MKVFYQSKTSKLGSSQPNTSVLVCNDNEQNRKKGGFVYDTKSNRVQSLTRNTES